ncbi:MAG: ATP phosphoribosyltransferase [Oscillospiraceae bacterium]|jgi:ATP phosphoribosyltransferase|nr:ATP phosphoribosyltransferase [Oscillospiraceae bacterium]
MIKVALPKGRLGERVYGLFERAGCGCGETMESSRKLVFENSEEGVCFFWVKPSDVAIYVEHGAADIGIAGLDILLEQGPDVFELKDLGLGKCRMVVAGKKGALALTGRTLRVATKFPNIAKRHYAEQSREIEIIRLNGSIELAPIVNLSDVIVDLVETGKTLKENALEVLEDVTQISARLIANKASFRFETQRIERLCAMLDSAGPHKD